MEEIFLYLSPLFITDRSSDFGQLYLFALIMGQYIMSHKYCRIFHWLKLKIFKKCEKINNIVARNYDLLTRWLQFCLLQCGYLYPNDINNEILLICTNCIA